MVQVWTLRIVLRLDMNDMNDMSTLLFHIEPSIE